MLPVPESQTHAGERDGSESLGHGPVTPGFDLNVEGDGDPYFVRTVSSNSGGVMGGGYWRGGAESPVIDQRLDPDSVLIAKGRSPTGGKRLSAAAMLSPGYARGGSLGGQSEESLGGGSFLRDDEDYSRRVLQVKNPT